MPDAELPEEPTTPATTDELALERAIIDLLTERQPGATICPSEAARAVAPGGGEDERWRDLMEPARLAARRLVDAGEIDVVQGGDVVDAASATGPIRLRLRVPS